MARLGGIWLEIRAKQDKMRGDLADAKQTVSRTADEMEGRLKGFGIAAAASVGAVGFAAIRVGTEFEKNMKTVQAYSGATGAGLEKLTAIARDLGATTEFSATEAAQGLQFLAAAGLTVEQQIAALPGVIDLATASQVDLATATDISTDTLTAFNLGVEELDRVSDALINTTSRTNTNLTQLGEAMKYVAPVAGQLGITVEKTAAMLGVLANSGIKASMGGTSLRSILLQTDKAAKKLGLEGGATLVEVLKEMEKQQTSTTEQTAIFGKIATTSVGILRNNIDKVDELTGALFDNEGATGDLADIMRDSLGVQIKTLSSSMEENLLKVFDIFKDDASIVVTSLTNVVREMGRWIVANDKLIRSKVVDTVKAFGKTILSIATFVNKNPDIVKFGLIGYVLWGRTGAIAGAAFGKVAKETRTFSQSLGTLSIDMKNTDLKTKLLAAAALSYAKNVKEANDTTQTFKITNKETGESIEKNDSLLDSLVTTMLEGVTSTDDLTGATGDLTNATGDLGEKSDETIPKVKKLGDELGRTRKSTETTKTEIVNLANELAAFGGPTNPINFSEAISKNFEVGFEGAYTHIETFTTAAADLGRTTSLSLRDAFSDNLFSVLTGDFDSLGDAWEGLMSNMLRSFTDSIAQMIVQSGALRAALSNPYVAAGTATVLGAVGINRFADSALNYIGDMLGAFSSHTPEISIGSKAHFGELMFQGGEFGGVNRYDQYMGRGPKSIREGRFIHITDMPQQEEEIESAIASMFYNIGNNLTDSFENFPVAGFGDSVSEQLAQIPIDLDIFAGDITAENFSEKLGEIETSINESVTYAYENAMINAALAAGVITVGFRDDMLQAVDDWLIKMERAAENSGSTIGNAFKAGLETHSFVDFGNSIRQQVFDSVFEGMISALTQSEVYRQALQPIFAGIEDAFTISMDTGDFDPEAFESAIQPVIDGLTPAIDALQPAFIAVNDVLDTVNEAIFGPRTQKLDDIDLTLSDLTTVNETGSTQIVESVEGLGSKIEELASRPINVTAVSVVDVVSLDARIEDVVVDREERDLTDGERTASL